jgi:mRNA-degrading endonuclease RelE of RelBE toxin-antitoxin system
MSSFSQWAKRPAMAYSIEFSEDAQRHLHQLTARDRAILLDAVEQHLARQPTKVTRKRKLLRANPLATWELRVGQFRVFYNVEDEKLIVIVIAIGIKDRNLPTSTGRSFIYENQFTANGRAYFGTPLGKGGSGRGSILDRRRACSIRLGAR